MSHCVQVATGLPVRIAAPSARNPGRMMHIVDHVKSALADGSLPSLTTVPWDSEDTLQVLADVGLGCCVDDPDERIALSSARTRLVALLDRLSGRSGVATFPVSLNSIFVGGQTPACGVAHPKASFNPKGMTPQISG